MSKIFSRFFIRRSSISFFFFPRWPNLFAKINYPRLTFNFSSSSDLSSQKIRRRFLRKAGDWLAGRKWIFVLLFLKTRRSIEGPSWPGPLVSTRRWSIDKTLVRMHRREIGVAGHRKGKGSVIDDHSTSVWARVGHLQDLIPWKRGSHAISSGKPL